MPGGPMEHPDEGQIHTWLDGQLREADATAMEAHVASCAECRAAVAEARGFVAAASRVVASLDDVPGGVIPKVQRQAQRPRRAWWNRPQLAAAALVFVMTGGAIVAGLGNGDDMVVTERRETALDAPAAASARVSGKESADLAAPAPAPATVAPPVTPTLQRAAEAAPARALADASLPAPPVAAPSAAAPAPVLAQAAIGSTSNAASAGTGGAGGAVAGGRASRSAEQRVMASASMAPAPMASPLPAAEAQLQAKSFAPARPESLAGCYTLRRSPLDTASRGGDMPTRVQLVDSAAIDGQGWRVARDRDNAFSRLAWSSINSTSFLLRNTGGTAAITIRVSVGNASAPDASAVRGGC